MRVRKTSIDVYNKIKASGVLSQRRWEVYHWLYHNGPATSRQAIIGTRPVEATNVIISQSRARLTELRDMGAVEEVGTTLDEVTGNEVILWDVTDRMPVPLKREKKATRQELEARIEQLELQNEQLRLRVIQLKQRLLREMKR